MFNIVLRWENITAFKVCNRVTPSINITFIHMPTSSTLTTTMCYMLKDSIQQQN